MKFAFSLALVIQLAAASNIWLADFTYAFWTSSAVSSNGRWLYIDGGEVWNGTSSDDLNANVLQSTLIIDLSQSWTNASLKGVIHNIEKPENFPFARSPTIWYSEPDDTIYSYGGEVYLNGFCPGNCAGWVYNGQGGFFTFAQPPPKNEILWELKADRTGLAFGFWAPSARSIQPGTLSPPTNGGLGVSTANAFYNFGGTVFSGSDSFFWTIPGLAQFNPTSRTWANTSISPVQFPTWGQAISAPSFGTTGVLIFIGGYTSNQQYYATDPNDSFDLFRPMNEIGIYDIATGSYYTQNATGDPGSIPTVRQQFCAVGAADAEGHFDIYVFGGNSVEFTPSHEYQETSANMYILSLPEFHWNVVNHTGQVPRTQHTCQRIGRRQMVTVGGPNPYSGNPDPLTNAIGVFDMTALSWVSRYDADALDYVRADRITKSVNQIAPPKWDNNALAKIFDTDTSTSSSNTGAIAGGVVAGVAVIVIGGLIWWFMRRRRRQRSYHGGEKSVDAGELSAESAPQEVGDTSRAELPTTDEWKVASTGLPGDHSAKKSYSPVQQVHELDASREEGK